MVALAAGSSAGAIKQLCFDYVDGQLVAGAAAGVRTQEAESDSVRKRRAGGRR